MARRFGHHDLELLGSAVEGLGLAVHDHRQASVATEAAQLARRNAPPLFRRFRCHYAGVLMDSGAWNEAEAELHVPIHERTMNRPDQAVKALARLGELRRRQGSDDDAARLFAEAEGLPEALAGEGSMALDRGEPAKRQQYSNEHCAASRWVTAWPAPNR